MTTRRFLSNRKVLFVVAAALLLGGVVFFLHHAQVNSASIPTDIAGRDAKRISDLKQIQHELELYFYMCGYYPGTSHAAPPCGPYVANDTWAGLGAALTGSVAIGVANVPSDPTIGTNYFYSAASHGTGYVIGARLEDAANPALSQSVHGVVNKMNCDNSTYCIQL